MAHYVQAAFHSVCAEATGAAHYVSLYRVESYYGGPEEGGWWGRDYHLESSQRFATADEAEAAAVRVRGLAADLRRDASAAWSRRCAAELDAAEARGIDVDSLPETDGPDSFEVAVESRPGRAESRGPRRYE